MLRHCRLFLYRPVSRCARMPSPRARGGAGRPNQSPTAIHRFSRYCTQHHQPATTTEQYSPLIALPAYACPVTFLADTYLSLAWTRETRCIPCRHMYSINWRHCTGTKKKNERPRDVVLQKCLVTPLVTQNCKNIEINPWNTWKNHEKS